MEDRGRPLFFGSDHHQIAHGDSSDQYATFDQKFFFGGPQGVSQKCQFMLKNQWKTVEDRCFSAPIETILHTVIHQTHTQLLTKKNFGRTPGCPPKIPFYTQKSPKINGRPWKTVVFRTGLTPYCIQLYIRPIRNF